MTSIEDQFEATLPALRKIRDAICRELEEEFEGDPAVDSFAVRVKAVDRFVEKAGRTLEDGSLKYREPFAEIQDQIGARIVVKFPHQVDEVLARLQEEYTFIENVERKPDSPEKFGYEAKHMVAALTPDLIDEDLPIKFMEVQVCTMFQHAWAEANHDLGYKPMRDMEDEERKLLALAAANAWGADRAFASLIERALE